MKRWMDMDSPRRACRGRRRRRGGRCTWSSPSRTAAWIAASCPRRNRRCTPTPSRGPVVTARAAGAAWERRKSRASTWLRQPGAGSGGAEEPLPRPSLAIYGKEGRGTAWLLSRGFGRYRGPRGVAWSGCLGRWEWNGPAMNDLSKEFGRGANGRRGQWGMWRVPRGPRSRRKRRAGAAARRKPAAEGVTLSGLRRFYERSRRLGVGEGRGARGTCCPPQTDEAAARLRILSRCSALSFSSSFNLIGPPEFKFSTEYFL